MRLIRFDAQKLPFHPLERQVIYFDVSPYSQKMGYPIVQLIDRYYEEIRHMFALKGLEFCFLPRISRELQYEELFAYFNPNCPAGEGPQWRPVTADHLAKYFANEEDIDHLPAGLIQYTGQQFGNDYVFSFTPIVGQTEDELFAEVMRYLSAHAIEWVDYRKAYREENENVRFSIAREAEVPELQEEPFTINFDERVPSRYTDSSSAEEEEEIGELMTQAQLLVRRLREHGVNDLVIEELFHPTQQLSRLRVKNYRIFLPDYQDMEIKMSPLPKAVFLLYLKHPEGIRFCDLPDYRNELYDIYAHISGRDNRADIIASINEVTNPIGNSINEKCSRVRQAFVSKFDDRLARNYYITGERGTAKKIILPRNMVTWDT